MAPHPAPHAAATAPHAATAATTPEADLPARLEGLLLGVAVGDALGLPFEGLSRRRAARWRPRPLRHRWFAGRGMISDDTEHAALTVAALAHAGGDPDTLADALGRGLRWWLAALPPAVGWATLRAGAKLWLGWSPRSSGVRSAGNGALVRALVIGAMTPAPTARAALVDASTRVTHTDPRALAAAQVIAGAAALASSTAPLGRHTLAALHVAEPAIARVLDGVGAALDDPARLADLDIAAGVSGFAPHTLAATLWAWLRHPDDLPAAVAAVIELGGDTDSTAALVGGLAGVRHRAQAIPGPWLDGIRDWPRSIPWLRRLAHAAAGPAATAEGAVPLPRASYPATLIRNLGFLVIALGHGLRRLAPPW